MKASSRQPWNGRYYRVGRVQDWLSLLGFELVGASMLAYQLPLQNENWRRKLDFVDNAGARWWPGLGAVYVIVGRKKEIGVTGRSVTRLAVVALDPRNGPTGNAQRRPRPTETGAREALIAKAEVKPTRIKPIFGKINHFQQNHSH